MSDLEQELERLAAQDDTEGMLEKIYENIIFGRAIVQELEDGSAIADLLMSRAMRDFKASITALIAIDPYAVPKEQFFAVQNKTQRFIDMMRWIQEAKDDLQRSEKAAIDIEGEDVRKRKLAYDREDTGDAAD